MCSPVVRIHKDQLMQLSLGHMVEQLLGARLDLTCTLDGNMQDTEFGERRKCNLDYFLLGCRFEQVVAAFSSTYQLICIPRF